MSAGQRPGTISANTRRPSKTATCYRLSPDIGEAYYQRGLSREKLKMAMPAVADYRMAPARRSKRSKASEETKDISIETKRGPGSHAG